MKKFALLVLVLIFCMSLFGQSPRLEGMGNVAGYISDDSSIFGYPGLIHNYKNNVYGYLGTSAGENQYSYNFGMNFGVNNMVLGTYFNKPIDSMAAPMFIEVMNIELDKSMQLFVGFMDNMAVKFTLAMDSYAELSPISSKNQDTEGATNIGIGFGYSTDMFGLGVDFQLPSYKKEYYTTATKTNEESESKMMVSLNGKAKFMKLGNVDLIGKLGMKFGSSTYDDGNDVTDDKEGDLLCLNLGVGGAYHIDENNVVVLGVTPFGLESISYSLTDTTYSDEGIKIEGKESTITLPAFNIGFESHLYKWLILRSGIEQYYYIKGETEEVAGVETIDNQYYDSMFNYSLGMSFILKNFTMDFVLNEDILHNGINIVTGQSTNDVVGSLMLKYNFK